MTRACARPTFFEACDAPLCIRLPVVFPFLCRTTSLGGKRSGLGFPEVPVVFGKGPFRKIFRKGRAFPFLSSPARKERFPDSHFCFCSHRSDFAKKRSPVVFPEATIPLLLSHKKGLCEEKKSRRISTSFFPLLLREKKSRRISGNTTGLLWGRDSTSFRPISSEEREYEKGEYDGQP